MQSLHFLFQLAGDLAAFAILCVFQVPFYSLLQRRILWHGVGKMPLLIYPGNLIFHAANFPSEREGKTDISHDGLILKKISE